MKPRPWLLLVLLLGLASALDAQAKTPTPLAGLNAYVHAVMQRWRVPGLAVAVVKDGKVVLARGYGVRELGRPAKVDANTLFGIASNTKAFTAAALGTLVSAGKLHWNDPVVRYLSGFRLSSPYVTQNLTVRDVLTHRSGYCDPTFMWLTGNYTRSEIIHRLRYQKPKYGFRAHFCYNNTMYLVAGQLVPAIAGDSWDDYVAGHFFKPLGMSRTSTRMGVFQRESDLAVPHGKINGKVVPIERMQTDDMAPVGGIKSSVADMSHWLIMLLNNGRYDGHTVLSSKVVATMESPQTVIQADTEVGQWARTQTPKSHFYTYGLGFFVQDYGGRKLVWHAGDISGMASALALVPSAHLGVVVLSNMNQNRAPEGVMFYVLQSYLGLPHFNVSKAMYAFVHERDAERNAMREKLAATRVAGARPPLPLEDYAGVYRNKLVGDVTVSVVNSRLKLAFGNPDFSGFLVPWHGNTFQVPWKNPLFGKSYVSFDLDALSRPVALRFAEPSGRFARVRGPKH
ncbi:MAG: serine hydrolase [Gammaproteobacteria bacterium]